MSSVTRHVDVGGHALRIETRGAGPPYFVCLNGLADTLSVWSRLAPALAARGQVVLVDQRAHGGSDAPPGPYRREDLATDIHALLDRLAIDRAVLVGHSMGGVVALTTALACPERVAGLVLLGTASEASPRVAAWYERIACAAEIDGLVGLARAIYGAGADRRVEGDPQGIAHVTRCLKSLTHDPLTPRLPAIGCPVLVVVGETDPMGVGASVIIQRHIPGAELEVIPGRGHWLHVEAADLLLDMVDRFRRSRLA